MILRAVAAGAAAAWLLRLAARWKAGDRALHAVAPAFAAVPCLALAAHDLGAGLGAHGRALAWFVLVVALPAGLASVVWLPHPALGANVAVGALALVLAFPMGDGSASATAGKGVLLGGVLAGLAVVVDLRTRSRAGSVLHYAAVGVLAGAKVLLGYELGALVAGLVLVATGCAELSVSLLLRRRSWAISGWLTLVLGSVALCAGALARLFAGGPVVVLVAVPLVAAAIALQRDGDRVRSLVLRALPDDVAASFPP